MLKIISVLFNQPFNRLNIKMKINKCHICQRPFFLEVAGIDVFYDYDPTACKKCNETAKYNSGLLN